MPEAPPLTKGLTVGQTEEKVGFLSSAIGESRGSCDGGGGFPSPKIKGPTSFISLVLVCGSASKPLVLSLMDDNIDFHLFFKLKNPKYLIGRIFTT